ncbi:MAG: alpha/beta hydrolase [Erysipelotrichaceae bacterium]|nr:alpha/beta hydrolase [Erysipelotrichaceae bacterium]
MRFIDQKRIPVPADTEGIERKYLDLQYAEGSERRKLDIYLPDEGDGPFPVLVDIHGGGWYFGYKSEHKLNPALHMRNHGYAIVSVGYSLSWMEKLPVQVYEVKAAIRFLRKHAEEYKLDPDRFAIWGESSGSHYASLVATSAAAGQLEDLPFGIQDEKDTVDACIGWFTPTNLGNIADQLYACGQTNPRSDNEAPDSPPAIVMGHVPNDNPERVKMMDPNTYVCAECPPFILYHGDNDNVVPYMSSLVLAYNLIRAIGEDKVFFHLVREAGHHMKFFDNEKTYGEILEFLDKFVKNKKQIKQEI